MGRTSSTVLPPSEVRRIAAAAGGIDPRTVATYLDGTRTPFASTRAAIERALKRMKRHDLIRTPVRVRREPFGRNLTPTAA